MPAGEYYPISHPNFEWIPQFFFPPELFRKRLFFWQRKQTWIKTENLFSWFYTLVFFFHNVYDEQKYT